MSSVPLSPEPPVDISVVITAYDEGPLLLEAVESVLEQQSEEGAPLPDWEVLVVHDRRADRATLETLDLVRRRHPGVRIVENTRRKGASGSRNTGIAHARGRWIAFLDGDDLWFPSALAARWRALAHAPDVEWVAADFLRGPDLDRIDNPLGFLRGNPHLQSLIGRTAAEDEGLYEEGSALRLRRPVPQFCRANLCSMGTVMVRRSLIAAAGGFHERLARGEDVHLWIRLAAVSDLLFVPLPLAFYRTRPSTLARRGNTLRAWDIVGTLDLLRRPALWRWFSDLYRTRLVRMMNEQAAELRRERRFASAASWSAASGLSFPLQSRAWRILAGSLLRRA